MQRVVAKSIGWTFIRLVGEQAALFVVFAILTRLLQPAAFGAVAVAVVLVEVAKLIASNGVAEAVLQSRDLDDDVADTAFWANLGLASATSFLMLAAAVPLGAVMNSRDLPAVVAALATVPVISAAGAIHTARITRGFGYRAIAMRSLAANLVAGAVSVVLALTGWGLWALVIQRVVAEAVLTLASWVAFPWRPRFAFNVGRARDLLGYGVHVTATGLIFTLGARAHELILGAAAGLAVVGFLRIGFRVQELILQFAVRPFSQVASPTFAKLRSDRDRLRHGYLRLQQTCAAIACPAFLGIGAVGDELIPLLFGEQWRASGHVAQILSLMIIPTVMNYFVTPALYAVGRPATATRIALVQLVLGALACVIAAPYGINWVAIAYVARAYVTLPYVAIVARREIGVTARAAAQSLWAPLGASILMAIGVGGFMHAVRGDMAPLLALPAGMALGGLLYGLFLFLLAPRFCREALNNALRLVRRRRAAAA